MRIQAGAGIAAFRVRPRLACGPYYFAGGPKSGARSVGGSDMKTITRVVTAFSLAIMLSACAGVLRSPEIADVKMNAGHYADRTVTLDGTVTSAWGLPLVPFKFYKVDDGTGEMTVLSRGGNRTPFKGSHVKVKGVVRDVAVFNGMPLGLHLEERDLNIKRNQLRSTFGSR